MCMRISFLKLFSKSPSTLLVMTFYFWKTYCKIQFSPDVIFDLVKVFSIHSSRVKGKLSFKKTTKHMEFSICWLTPPPPSQHMENLLFIV